jgi:hypothetical protein
MQQALAKYVLLRHAKAAAETAILLRLCHARPAAKPAFNEPKTDYKPLKNHRLSPKVPDFLPECRLFAGHGSLALVVKSDAWFPRRLAGMDPHHARSRRSSKAASADHG